MRFARIRVPLHVLIETHGALHQVWEIAALKGIASLDFGLMDFVSAHHGAITNSAMHSPGQFDHALLRHAKTQIVTASLAHSVVPTHNVTIELNDVASVRDDARRARQEFGFLRMWSIHPNQIEPILSAMHRPDYSQLDGSKLKWSLRRRTRRGGRYNYAAACTTAPRIDYYWNLFETCAPRHRLRIAGSVHENVSSDPNF